MILDPFFLGYRRHKPRRPPAATLAPHASAGVGRFDAMGRRRKRHIEGKSLRYAPLRRQPQELVPLRFDHAARRAVSQTEVTSSHRRLLRRHEPSNVPPARHTTAGTLPGCLFCKNQFCSPGSMLQVDLVMKKPSMRIRQPGGVVCSSFFSKTNNPCIVLRLSRVSSQQKQEHPLG